MLTRTWPSWTLHLTLQLKIVVEVNTRRNVNCLSRVASSHVTVYTLRVGLSLKAMKTVTSKRDPVLWIRVFLSIILSLEETVPLLLTDNPFGFPEHLDERLLFKKVDSLLFYHHFPYHFPYKMSMNCSKFLIFPLKTTIPCHEIWVYKFNPNSLKAVNCNG